MVNEGEKREVYTFPPASVASHFDSKLHVTLEVILDTTKVTRASTMVKAGNLFASVKEKGTKVAATASDVMEKVEVG